MPQSMRDIRRKINSFENTKKITKAMKMVAASKLRKAQESAKSTKLYASKLQEMVLRLTSKSNTKQALLDVRQVKKTGYIVITSDRGLCGGYNANLLRVLTKQLRERHTDADQYALFVVGNKGIEYLTRRNYPVIKSISGLSDTPTFADVKELSMAVISSYVDYGLDQVYLCYNEFVNVVVQKPSLKVLLPLSSETISNSKDDDSENSSDSGLYDYEPSEEEVLAQLLPRYVESIIYSAVGDAKASEFAAKMTAMGNATDNATEMIGDLVIQYNRARQATITQEIAEIVGGAMAL